MQEADATFKPITERPNNLSEGDIYRIRLAGGNPDAQVDFVAKARFTRLDGDIRVISSTGANEQFPPVTDAQRGHYAINNGTIAYTDVNGFRYSATDLSLVSALQLAGYTEGPAYVPPAPIVRQP